MLRDSKERTSDTNTLLSFPSPYELKPPEGSEGWEEMYPMFYLFNGETRNYEEQKFWFLDNVHNPDPIPPFDLIWLEAWLVGLNQMTTRILMVPRAKGIDHRILYGYFYISPTVGEWGDEIVKERAEEFKKRAGYFYDNWDKIYEKWFEKINKIIEETRNIRIELPEKVDLSLDYLAKNSNSPAHTLYMNYRKLIELAFEAEAQRHFELANLSYAALLALIDFLKQKFPGIRENTIVKMVQGIDTYMLRPDEELRKLAKLAFNLGLTAIFNSANSWAELVEKLSSSEEGRLWLEQLNRIEYPWFYVHSGPTPNREYHYFESWAEDKSFVLSGLKSYIKRLERNESIDRDKSKLIEERERIRREYRELLSEEEAVAFDNLLRLAEKTYRYAEDHVFIISNWFRTIFYMKIKELGDLLTKYGYIEKRDDIFYLHHREVDSILEALIAEWATMNPSNIKAFVKSKVKKRKEILASLRKYRPPPALGKPPEEVTDPYMIMLWGITGDKIRDWLKISVSPAGKVLEGFPASSGIVEGQAHVIVEPSQLHSIEDGAILVCPITSPNWGPVFPRIKALVTDIGGMMSHAAIVAREYGIPAVVGTAYATHLIKTGDKIRVNGDEGRVYIL
jgi:pyruvate, water dikinase